MRNIIVLCSFVVNNATELEYHHYAVSMPFWITATELSRRYNRNSGSSIRSMCVVVRAFFGSTLRQRLTRPNTVTNSHTKKTKIKWFCESFDTCRNPLQAFRLHNVYCTSSFLSYSIKWLRGVISIRHEHRDRSAHSIQIKWETT